MKLKIHIGTWYTLFNYFRPHDRALDYDVRVVELDRKFVHFETRPALGRTRGTPLSLPKAAFLERATLYRLAEGTCHENSY